MMTLLVHGFLKPNELREEMKKSPEYQFIDLYQTMFTVLGNQRIICPSYLYYFSCDVGDNIPNSIGE